MNQQERAQAIRQFTQDVLSGHHTQHGENRYELDFETGVDWPDGLAGEHDSLKDVLCALRRFFPNASLCGPDLSCHGNLEFAILPGDEPDSDPIGHVTDIFHAVAFDRLQDALNALVQGNPERMSDARNASHPRESLEDEDWFDMQEVLEECREVGIDREFLEEHLHEWRDEWRRDYGSGVHIRDETFQRISEILKGVFED